ncbi:MAG: GDSL family lipase [Acidimicrobiales bacterium]|nr:MAG: GDSL family lipase [Acidimicrobiales bacterium]
MVALLLVATPVAAAYSDKTSSGQSKYATQAGLGPSALGLPSPAASQSSQESSIASVPVSLAKRSAAKFPVPSSMAGLGDSITRGFNACGFYFDCVERSWSTGTSREVGSHYLGLRALNPAIDGKNFNDAKRGAVAADMVGQAKQAVGQKAEYITLLIGANDACKPTESAMTPVQTYRHQVDAALTAIQKSLPNTRVFIASIPDIKKVWSAGRGNFVARSAWSIGKICQSMLANPTSTAPADNARRDRVRQRVADYNGVLGQLCASYGRNCKFDSNAVFNHQFGVELLSNFDFFHPNGKGQQELARITRAAGFTWNQALSPVSMV